MTINKYSKYFNEDMSRIEANNKYFPFYEEVKRKGELELLDRAYYPVIEIILDKTQALSRKGMVI